MQCPRILLLALTITFISSAVPLGAQTLTGTISFGPMSWDGAGNVTTLLTAPGYTVTAVSGDDPATTGIGTRCGEGNLGCTPAQIASYMMSGFGIIGFPPNGSMVVNGQLFGMWGFPGLIATSFNSSLSANGTLTVWGDASGYGQLNECDLSGQCMPIPNAVNFVFGGGPYFGQFVPDPMASGSYDLQSMTIGVLPYKAVVQPPINSDNSSIFKANRGVIPVKFMLTLNNAPTCDLPSATISVTRTAGGVLGSVDESTYSMAADSGANFRIDKTYCQYVYNLAASALGVGAYEVGIRIDGSVIGKAVFALK